MFAWRRCAHPFRSMLYIIISCLNALGHHSLWVRAKWKNKIIQSIHQSKHVFQSKLRGNSHKLRSFYNYHVVFPSEPMLPLSPGFQSTFCTPHQNPGYEVCDMRSLLLNLTKKSVGLGVRIVIAKFLLLPTCEYILVRNSACVDWWMSCERCELGFN